MPRKGRRDCRKSQSKNNPMNLRVEALQKDIDRRNRPADEADVDDAKAPAEPASDWTGSAEEWKQVIDEYRRPVDLGQIFNRKR